MSAIDNKQLKAAQAEAATATDTYTHVFKKPFTHEDKTYEQRVHRTYRRQHPAGL